LLHQKRVGAREEEGNNLFRWPNNKDIFFETTDQTESIERREREKERKKEREMRLSWWADRGVRLIRGLSFFLVIFASLIVGSGAFSSPIYILVWCFSTRFWRYFNSTFIEFWHNLFVFYLEVWNKKRWVLTGDNPPPKEWVFVISNHPSEVDWMCWWPIARRKAMLGDLKVILKQELAYVPGLGNGMDDLEFLFLARDWEKDKHTVSHRIASWKRDNMPLWLAFFPEGTDFSPEKHKKSIKYAEENGLAHYRNLLVPRVTGFVSCVRMLGGYIDAVYDFTIGYAQSATPTPLRALLDIAPKEVHLHIRRYPISHLPLDDEEKMKEWIYKCWKEKDDLLDYFKQNQRFPTQGGNGPTELKPLPILYGWALWWITMIALSFYRCYTSTGFLIMVIFCTLFRAATTYHKGLRQWRGLLPPTGFNA